MSNQEEGGASAGAKRRSGIPMMRRVAPPAPNSPPPVVRAPAPPETDKDSGLSSGSTTPTNGSPPPRHQARNQGGMIPRPKTRMVDIIAASRARLQESSERSLSVCNECFIKGACCPEIYILCVKVLYVVRF